MLSARRAALQTLIRVLEDGAYTNLALKESAANVAAKDVPYLNALVNETRRGDIFAIHSAGAYGQVMNMRYNQRDLAKAYYSDDFNK